MPTYDVVLLHPPAVFDFRTRPRLWGPLADVVPSSAVFEMYPVGLTSLLHRLEQAGFRTALVNIANHLVHDDAYDVDGRLKGLDSPIVGIDLHWLPHAAGALELARRVKRFHPDAFVVLGGLSATYFHEEIIREHPAVDAVLRGDSTEAPMEALARCLIRGQGDLRQVPNLTYRERRGAQAGTIAVNPLSYVPGSLAGIQVPAYGSVMRAALHQHSFHDVEPYAGWRKYPTTMVLTLRGCTQSCIACGGSRQSYARLCARTRPAFWSAGDLAADLHAISHFTRHPVFVVGDIRLQGLPRLSALLERWRVDPPQNELVFELFGVADRHFFEELQAAVPRYSLELSIESQDPELRRINRKFAVSNEAIEATVQAALDHGARKVDLFFMTGLSGQDASSARRIVDYAQGVVKKAGCDPRLHPFVAPLGPFIDPGSSVWEDPERYGYRIFYRTLADHERALRHRTWRRLLAYETRWLTRRQLVDVTYDLARDLNDLKDSYGAITADEAALVRERMDSERQLLEVLEAEEDRELQEGEDDLGPSIERGGMDLTGGSLSPPSEITWKHHRAHSPAP
ncbi:MAG: TIGR04190 family B12-binding domain/radical SAM domain protein [Clostridia bacterium]